MIKKKLPYKNLYLYILNKEDDIDYINTHIQVFFDILTEAYKHIDGCGIYTSPKHMKKNNAYTI